MVSLQQQSPTQRSGVTLHVCKSSTAGSPITEPSLPAYRMHMLYQHQNVSTSENIASIQETWPDRTFVPMLHIVEWPEWASTWKANSSVWYNMPADHCCVVCMHTCNAMHSTMPSTVFPSLTLTTPKHGLNTLSHTMVYVCLINFAASTTGTCSRSVRRWLANFVVQMEQQAVQKQHYFDNARFASVQHAYTPQPELRRCSSYRQGG